MTRRESSLPLFFISALHENGGGFLGRLFDGHPALKVYPFEMQLGTKQSQSDFQGYCFQSRYRWPRFPKSRATPHQLYESFIDSELKRCLSNRNAGKFASFHLQFDSKDRSASFKRLLRRYGGKPSRPAIIESYLQSFFACWNHRKKSGRERAILGHCPVILFDAPDIFRDFPKARMVHLVRNPLTTFHDTRLRRPDLSVDEFCAAWNLTAWTAFCLEKKFPGRFLRIRYEKLLSQRAQTLKEICRFFGLRFSSILMQPTWNGKRLNRISPFGGIPEPSLKYEQRAEKALAERIRIKIREQTGSTEKLCSF